METDSIVKPPESRKLKSGRVRLHPGEDIGEHVTEEREELLIVLKGTATLLKGDETIILDEGQTHFVPEGVKHDVKNNSASELEYIYVVSLF
ncbi:MAG: cupin domain-containing protein [Candidatus Aenigmatarchaeota archaeon]|nr:cupin domain-containing protein [Nanoarchaeota archaeon]